MKLLGSQSILNGPVTFKVPPGQYAGFQIRCAGTNQAAQTLTRAQCGLLTATWRGFPLCALTHDNLAIINNLSNGVVETASAAGGAFAHSSFYMASYVGDGNIFDIVDNDDLYFSLDLSGVTGVIVASGTVTLHGIPAEGAQAYVPHLFSQTRNIAASGTDVFLIQHDNIGFLFVNGLTNIADITVEKDGESVVKATPAELLAESNFEHRVETALTAQVLLNLARSRTIDEALSDTVRVTITAGSGGAATPAIVDLAYDFVDDVLERSKSALDAKRTIKWNRKLSLNKGRSVKVAKKVAGVQ